MCKINSYDVFVYAKCFDADMPTAHQFTVLTDHGQHHGQHRPAHSVGVPRGTPSEKITFWRLCKARKGEFWLVLYLHVLGHRFRLCGRLDTPGHIWRYIFSLILMHLQIFANILTHFYTHFHTLGYISTHFDTCSHIWIYFHTFWYTCSLIWLHFLTFGYMFTYFNTADCR